MISGASRGIGRAIARNPVGMRAATKIVVSAGARDLRQARRELFPHWPARAFSPAATKADDRDSHARWLEETLARVRSPRWPGQQCGHQSNGFSIEAGEEAELDALVSANVKGPLFLTRACPAASAGLRGGAHRQRGLALGRASAPGGAQMTISPMR